jgi:putative hydrolase of the HAD superfamily
MLDIKAKKGYSKNMIKVVLFDADGVLLTGTMFSKYLQTSLGLNEDIIQEFFDNEFKKCLTGQSDIKDELPKYLKRWGWKKSIDDFLDLWFKSEYKMDDRLIRYVRTLRKKGINCSVATNQEKNRAEYMQSQMGFNTLFNKIYASSHLGYMKSNRNFFAKVMQDLTSIQKEEILFWDNSVRNVLVAKRFGINAEHYISFPDFQKKTEKYL